MKIRYQPSFYLILQKMGHHQFPYLPIGTHTLKNTYFDRVAAFELIDFG